MRINIHNLYSERKKENLTLFTESYTDWDMLYPFIVDTETGLQSTVNFMKDYKQIANRLDAIFNLRYGNMKFLMSFNKDVEMSVAAADFTAMIENVIIMNIDNWARIYYALSKQYNPIWNKEGKEEHHTTGKITDKNINSTTGKLSGAAFVDSTSTSTSYQVPYNGNAEKETGRVQSITNPISNKSGEVNNVDYTEVITSGGNIGTTRVDEMLSGIWDFYLNNFWNLIFEEIKKELLFYEV